MEKAERYEVLGDIYKLIIPIYEKLRNFQVLYILLCLYITLYIVDFSILLLLAAVNTWQSLLD